MKLKTKLKLTELLHLMQIKAMYLSLHQTMVLLEQSLMHSVLMLLLQATSSLVKTLKKHLFNTSSMANNL